LRVRHDLPTDDSFLLHTVRMALRDQLSAGMPWAAGDETDRRDLADVATGVFDEPAARFLRQNIGLFQNDTPRVAEMLHHVARFGADGSGAELVQELLPKYTNDRGQFELFVAVQRGYQERGAKLPADIISRAGELGHRLLTSTNIDDLRCGIELATAI